MPPETLALLAKMFGGNNQQMPDMAGIIKELNTPSAGEQQRLAYQGSQAPSYMKNENNPFNSGYFQNQASDMSPEARLASQGGSAMNQWGMLGALPGVDAEKLGAFNDQRALASARTPMVPQDRVAGAIAASPSPWQSMESQGYKMKLPDAPPRPATGTPAAGAWMDLIGAQNTAMAAPGGLQQFWQHVGTGPTVPQAQAAWAPFAAKAKGKAKGNAMAGLR